MISDINIKINQDQCYACGVCVERCILDNLRLSVAPCRQSCPLKMNCQGYVRLLAQGRLEEAAGEIQACTPFGAILGHVCHHPCEVSCERGPIDGPVHLRALKRFLSDLNPEMGLQARDIPPDTGRRAAVVGSGPAGLTSAYELRRLGHQVTVYEAAPEPGGMLKYGIPSFRLPVDLVDRTIEYLSSLGIVFETGRSLGADLDLEWLAADYQVVLLGLGAGKPRALDPAKTNLKQVIQGLSLLSEAKAGLRPRIGPRVLVIGGGNTALDAALTCRYLGVAEVKVVCLENQDEMPAFELEIEDARAEQIEFYNGYGPQGLSQTPDNRIAVDFSRCLSLYDDQGLFNPSLEPECTLEMTVDTVVVAAGQMVDTSVLPPGMVDTASGLPAADPLTLQSPALKNVFFCGDCQSGPSSVVEAMASGKEAALSADRYLAGEGLRWGRGFWNGPHIKEYQVDQGRILGGPRARLKKVPSQNRRLDQETEITLTLEEARAEAERCLSCGRPAEINKTCWYCLPCEIECPVQALEVRMPYLVR